MCRFCKYYRPDERFKGVIGECEKHERVTDISNTCEAEEEGSQRWMNGEQVKE